ncbi:MAG TPA: tripartite tricarboxylate transporter substrate-binding protein [Xanthobacteraceae bacterium]|jgi:tripartite-type tricarboxylate transporter receptor subunit TctC
MSDLKVVGLTASLLAAAGGAQAQDWPTRPITMVVTFAAGSGDDLVARIVAPRMAEILGQPVVIENVGGAGGMNGANRVARAASDGYQIVLGGTGTFAANQTLYKHPLYNAVSDFKPVALIVQQPMVLITRNDLPATNLQEFIAYAKANQAKMQFGSGGAGSATHLACVLLDLAIGVNVAHVPYRSAVMAMQDMVGGRIDYVCPITSTAVAQIEGKRVKGIAMLSSTRSPVLPDLPTASEQGLAGFDVYIWNGIFVPKNTPDAIVKKLHDAAVGAMNTPAVDQRIRQMGGALVAPERRSPEYLRQFVEDEIKKWAAPIKTSGLSMD